MEACTPKLKGVISLDLKKWLKETIDNSPWLPQETKNACTKIIDKEKKQLKLFFSCN